jgi:hypothetical protein
VRVAQDSSNEVYKKDKCTLEGEWTATDLPTHCGLFGLFKCDPGTPDESKIVITQEEISFSNGGGFGIKAYDANAAQQDCGYYEMKEGSEQMYFTRTEDTLYVDFIGGSYAKSAGNGWGTQVTYTRCSEDCETTQPQKKWNPYSHTIRDGLEKVFEALNN